MKNLLSAFLLVPLLFLTGCPVNIPKAPEGPALKQLPDGTIEHAASRMQFPPAIGDFLRTNVQPFDTDGLSISAGYNLTSPYPIAITVYIYPSPPIRSFGSTPNAINSARSYLAQNLYQKNKAEILNAHPDAQLIAEQNIPPKNQSSQFNGNFTRFSYTENFAGQIQPLESQLYLFSYIHNTWTIKLRITFPANAPTRPEITQFLKTLPWPPKPN